MGQTCSYTQAVAGDGCYSIAERCDITQAQLISYNGDPNLCSDVQVGQYLCCSSGTLPDFTPQPNANGSCLTYTIQSGDDCSAIATANTMTVADIENRNNNTWGWAGCSYLLPGEIICLSLGTPPMPGAVANAVCGPTVPGTPQPADMSTLADLNPCPLNVCCNVWGQCGITSDFCVPSPADTGAPGTATPGSNGCVASCGMTITNNAAPPASFKTLGYWEAWNGQRPCLHMEASQIDTSYYTHVHFAFGNISDTFDVDISGLAAEFADFQALTGVQRILSFGGWSFSTDYDTFPIFRQGVTAAERQTFANNVASFIVDNDLDGVDFDWEYPGATDIPGIPPGSPEDGPNYLAFLTLVRAALPAGKTLAIAAPASYWYLRGFPIADIANVVDYIVYMTYDLHGQWDYGNAYSDDGCPAGNCLRSHVNLTETTAALAMITHAGVPASKVIVGMALYGRSFEMTTPGCYSEDCTYVGPLSGATPGECTGTASYISNFEIRNLIATTSNAQQYSSDQGDIVVYNNVQWISWMTEATYDSRLSWITGLNFGGTADWAIDLDEDYSPSDAAGEGDNGSGPIYISPDIYTESDPIIECYPPCTLILPPFVLPNPTTIIMDPVTVTFTDTWDTTVTINGGIVTTSGAAITSTVITLPPITTQTIYLSNVVWEPTPDSGGGSMTSSTLAGGIIWLTSSIIPPPATITQSQISGPPIIWTYSPGPFPTPPSNGPWPPPPPPPGPPPGFPSTVRITDGPPKPTCLPLEICGFPCLINCHNFGCIGICGCIGPFCPSGTNCVGVGCTDPGPGGNPDDQTCREQQTASLCNVDCSVLEYPASTTTTCNDPDCTRTFTACSATDSTSTSTTTLGCPSVTPYDPPNPDDPVPLIGDGADGGVIVQTGDFDTPPETFTVPTTSTIATPTTQTAIINPTASADCSFWDAGLYWLFEIYNIENWVSDEGAALHKQEGGCGALTGWSWKDNGLNGLGQAWFNLPFFMKDGCVERAIVSAGGPKLSCVARGLYKKKRAAVSTFVPTPPPESITPTYIYSTTVATPTYIPMTWDDSNTEILTWTLTTTVVSNYTWTFPGYSGYYTNSSSALNSTTSNPGISSSISSTSVTSSSVTSISTSSSVKSTSSSSSPTLSVTSSTSVATIISSYVTSSSTSSSALPTGPSIKPSVGLYNYYGCQTEATNIRALSLKSTAYENMTLESCSADCAGYIYFGTEYGRECYCGNSFNTGSVPAPATDCSFPCGGNALEYCGAGNRLSVYELSSAASSSSSSLSSSSLSSSSLASSSSSSSKISSFVTSSSVASLSSTSSSSDSSTSSTSSSSKSSSVTTSSSSTSSSSISSSTLSSKSTSSSTLSSSSSSSTSISSSSSAQSSTSSSTQSSTTSSTVSSSAASSTPIWVAGNANYELIGCFQEPNGSRALTYSAAADNMTVEQCLGEASGYNYIGLEYGRECWWDNTLSSGSINSSSLVPCNMVCAGNPLEYCGAANYLTLYLQRNQTPATTYVQSLGNYQLLGCYAEPSTGRALPTLYANDSMTPGLCIGAAGGATYAGIEYGRECWYGDTLNPAAVLEATDANCNFVCPGDSFQYCGAGSHLLVYENQA